MRFGRRLLARVRERRVRRLVNATPRRRVRDLGDLARVTVVGRVVDVAGDGLAVSAWRGDDQTDGPVSRREVRPFTVDDGTGTVRVRVPPDGYVVAAEDGKTGFRGRDGSVRDSPSVRIGRGDTVSVTGRVVSRRGTDRLVTGPGFVAAAL
ncbi:hypothetical protein C440_03923 [Haloferax mucosum ATCC BAA-1512]|uniref:Uncharacterized protein n=1 Tax=Haloferax mucosum ATCC BAA-1512 TaxID=662479 RepID=M0ILI0_9EURY|nr:hypothetical protein C440_03923 [Haloferax mucosum ATCC BAA-1512]